MPILAGGAAAAKSSGSFTKSPGVSTVADPYGSVREPFLRYITGEIGKPGPSYTGEVTAPMSAQEKASLGKVDEYANTGFGDTFKAGNKQIQDTLNGNYDPSTSAYYQAVKAKSAQNLADTQRNIASNSAGAGRYFTGSRIKQQARAANDSALNLDVILGQQAENERQRQISVLPQALAYGQAEQQLPLAQANALQTYGALPRMLQQNTDDVNLSQWNKANYDYPLSILQLIAGVQSPPVYQQNPDRIGQIMELLGKAGTAAAAGAGAGCWVAAEVFGGWDDERTHNARNFINNIGPVWFKEFYLKHGEHVALYIHNKPLLKMTLRPLFELFSLLGSEKVVCNGIV